TLKKKGSFTTNDNIIPDPTKATSDEESNGSDAKPARRLTGKRKQTGVQEPDGSSKGVHITLEVLDEPKDEDEFILTSNDERIKFEKKTVESGKTNEESDDGDEEMHDAENIDKDEDDQDEDDIDSKVVEPSTQKKRRHDDKDQDPYAGSDQGMKKRKNYLDAKPSKKTNHSSSSKGLLKIQVAQKKFKIAFGNADLSSRVELISSKINVGRRGARGGLTPRGERMDARRGRGGGRGNADDDNIASGLAPYHRHTNQQWNYNQGNGNDENEENNINGDNNDEGRESGIPRDDSNNNNGNGCSAILKAGGLTDDDVRNGLLKRCSEIMKESGETGKKEDTRTNNKRVKIGKATDSGKKENKSLHPKCTKCGYHH
nr:hypothetical protein [Tanacetum cinerariifolium]